ncbi:MAG: glutamate 5-kinase [Actinomycetota bacterium]|nr:glutamate 5-kinase [Actinomycetota bacterium]
MLLVVKVGSSSVTTDDFGVNHLVMDDLIRQISRAIANGHKIVLVTSGAIALGLGRMSRTTRPSDIETLQVASSVGQGELFAYYAREFAKFKTTVGQILLSASDFMERRQYLSAKATLAKMLELGVLPIVNENDAIADDEIRLGDNDRIAALVAGLIGAERLILLTDQDGLYSADPRFSEDATLIEQVEEVSREVAEAAGGSGSNRGSGGMATKLMAARIAAWSSVETLITSSANSHAIADGLERRSGAGTWVSQSRKRLPARKLWIAFARPTEGVVFIDDGARKAITERNSSLLSVGILSFEGEFEDGSVVEVRDSSNAIIAKGEARLASKELASAIAMRGSLGVDSSPLFLHRDEMVILF